MPEANFKIWKLEPETEFRVESLGQITLTLTAGVAEIFGSEIIPGIDHVFVAKKLAVFTWQGCSLKVTGEPSVAYIGNETPMRSYLNVHLGLQNMQNSRVLVLGPSDVGKTSLAKILVNYAAKVGGKPLYVDLDPMASSISIPGTIGAMMLSKTLDPQEDFFAHSTLTGSTPLLYYYGYSTLQEKMKLYSKLVSSLAASCQKKETASGFVMDSPSFLVESAGFPLLTQIIQEFKVNVILVIGHERLYSDLKRSFPDTLSVLKLTKSGGVVSRDKTVRRQLQIQAVKEYFYGSVAHELTPFSQTVPFSNIVVRRVGDVTIVPSSALPIGFTQKEEDLKFVKVEPGDLLLHSVLAISSASLASGSGDAEGVKAYTPEEEAQVILSSNVLGFIYVSDVDDQKRKLTVLCPQPGHLPQRYVVMGTLKWIDS